MAKKINENEQQTKKPAEEAAKKAAQEARLANDAEKAAKWEAELLVIEKSKQQAEEMKKAREETRRAETLQKAETKKAERLAHSQAKLAAKEAKKAQKGPHRFARTMTSLYIDDNNLKLLITKGRHVIKWAETPLDAGLITDGLIKDPGEIAQKIKTLFLEQSIKPKKIILGFSGLHCLSRVITLPVLSGAALKEAVQREAERELPVPLANLYLAWQIVRAYPQELKIFLMAYNRNVADALVQTMRNVGVKPYLMDLAPLAVAQVVNQKTATIADVRPGELDIVIMVDGVPELIRSLPLPPGRGLREKLPIISEELERTIKFYQANAENKIPGNKLSIFVSGEPVDEPELYQSLSDRLGQAVLSPLPPLKYPASMSPSHYMVNIGLVLKKIQLGREAGLSRVNVNALPEPYRPRHPSMTRVLAVPAGVLAAAAVVALFLLVQNTGAQTALLNKNLASANTMMSQRQAQQTRLNNSISSLEKQMADSTQDYQLFSSVISSLKGQREMVTGDIPMAIDNAQASNVTLLTIKHSENSVAITGNAPTEDEVLTYASSLQSSGRYSEVVMSGITTNQDQTVDFKLTLKTR